MSNTVILFVLTGFSLLIFRPFLIRHRVAFGVVVPPSESVGMGLTPVGCRSEVANSACDPVQRRLLFFFAHSGTRQ